MLHCDFVAIGWPLMHAIFGHPLVPSFFRHGYFWREYPCIAIGLFFVEVDL
jgi:hypothetical protein